MVACTDAGETRANDEDIEVFDRLLFAHKQRRALRKDRRIGHLRYLAFQKPGIKSIVRYCL